MDNGRKDLYINEAINIAEVILRKEVVFIVAEFPKIDFVLAYRNTNFQPWVAAWGYHNGSNSWSQGYYFETITEAMKYIQNLLDEDSGRIPYMRLDEIASKAIDGLFEDDPYEARIYCDETLELEDNEKEYFGITEKESDYL